VASGLTPFGLSAAHSAYRVGARMLFSSIPGVALAYGSRHPGLPAVAAKEFGSHSLASSHSFPANRRFAEFQSPEGGTMNSRRFRLRAAPYAVTGQPRSGETSGTDDNIMEPHRRRR